MFHSSGAGVFLSETCLDSCLEVEVDTGGSDEVLLLLCLSFILPD